jgi:hypothetical protein
VRNLLVGGSEAIPGRFAPSLTDAQNQVALILMVNTSGALQVTLFQMSPPETLAIPMINR